MTQKAIINKQTGLVDTPILPCYKKEGALCKLRTIETDKFECLYDAERCPWERWRKEVK